MSEIVSWFDRPITWRSISRLALGLVIEFALISLISEAPDALKAATVIRGAAGLIALECEKYLQDKYRKTFFTFMSAMSFIYIGFIGYAIYAKIYEATTKSFLGKCYVDSVEFATKRIPTEANKFVSSDFEKYSQDFKSWEQGCADMLLQRVGPPASERFMDKSEMPSYLYLGMGAMDDRYNEIRNALAADRKNLSLLLSSPAFLN